MRRKTVWFLGPQRLEIREEELPAPGANRVLVQVELTGISAGTEMLVYRGELPDVVEADVDPVTRGLQYPTPFGYCSVGRVMALGEGVDAAWKNRGVFAFQPHASAYIAPVDALVPVPNGVLPEDAVFLANMETAVNLLHDAAPLLGERVLVLGLGTVGLLTAALMRSLPLACLVAADLHPVRRAAAAKLGMTAVIDPADPDFVAQARAHTQAVGFDAVIDVTGNPSALDLALATTAYSGRVLVGSWYGRKRAPLDLGGRFHRSRIRLQSSQVSTIAPELSGRWDKRRRFDVAWDAVQRIRPGCWISHRFPIERALEAFQLLDTTPETSLQVALEYTAAP